MEADKSIGHYVSVKDGHVCLDCVPEAAWSSPPHLGDYFFAD